MFLVFDNKPTIDSIMKSKFFNELVVVRVQITSETILPTYQELLESCGLQLLDTCYLSNIIFIYDLGNSYTNFKKIVRRRYKELDVDG